MELNFSLLSSLEHAVVHGQRSTAIRPCPPFSWLTASNVGYCSDCASLTPAPQLLDHDIAGLVGSNLGHLRLALALGIEDRLSFLPRAHDLLGIWVWESVADPLNFLECRHGWALRSDSSVAGSNSVGANPGGHQVSGFGAVSLIVFSVSCLGAWGRRRATKELVGHNRRR